ncbi:hypothetical protein NEMIN01_2497, partial [Nematocida minor]|uniref:uncharacterized protein n=1 Tax=Nematocida minor TaxID=1912983 RepID=UPI00221E94E0
MLVVRVFQWVSQSKKSVQLTAGSILAALAVSTLWLLFQVSPESIPCHSDQLIKNAEYYVMPTESKVHAVSEYRDVEYDQYNMILLTGSEKVSHLIAKIHKTAQTMENRTKGYDIKIGKCSSMEMMKYFLVLEIEKSSETVLYTRNRGWQANSDVFSIFCDRLEISEIKKREPQSLVNLVFNKISLGVDEDETEVVLGILHNIHNLYSHSL